MKLKVTGCSGEMILTVTGENQSLVIREENGGFTIEMMNAVAPTVAQEENCQTMSTDEVESSVDEKMPMVAVESIIEEETPSPPDNGMFEKLVALRKSLATADKVPPYLIFHNKTLQEMADKMPADMQEMGNIPGIGQAKLQKYGQAFLDIIAKGAA